jgi:hypothetical protein
LVDLAIDRAREQRKYENGPDANGWKINETLASALGSLE